MSFFAIGNQDIPFVIDMTDITGQKVTLPVYLTKYFFVFIRSLPVALHDLGTADGNLTVFTPGQFVEPGIDVYNFYIGARQRETDGADLSLHQVRRVDRSDGGGFAQSIAFKNDGAGFFFKLSTYFRRQRSATGKTPHERIQIVSIEVRMIGKGNKNRRHGRHDRRFVLLNYFQYISKWRIPFAGIRDAYQLGTSGAGRKQGAGHAEAMVPRQHTKVGVKPAFAFFFRLCARFMHQANPLVRCFQIVGKIGMRQRCSLGYPGGPTGINNQGRIFSRIDLDRRRPGLGRRHHVIEEKVTGFVMLRLWNLAQQPAYNCFNLRQVRFDTANDNRFHAAIFNGRNRGRIKLRVIHTKNHLGPGVIQLVVQFVGCIQRVAGYAHGTGFENAEKYGRIMGKIGQKDGHPIPLLNTAGN